MKNFFLSLTLLFLLAALVLSVPGKGRGRPFKTKNASRGTMGNDYS